MAEGKKELLRQIPCVKLWLVLMLTLTFSGVLLVAAHLTHSLTVRVEAYHTLYNVLTLCGCLLTMKLSSGPQSLHNTFGWARLEVLSMLTTLLFLTALCFSVSIESVQTALHVGHQDAMHHPLPVLVLGGVGVLLNALVFLLIGGYTHHQGCFLEMRVGGSVWVGRQVTQEAVQAGRRTLSSSDALAGSNRRQGARQLLREVVRDTCGLLIMGVCAALVYWDDGGALALYIDPALAVTSAALLIWLSHPYAKECCHILLQTIPGHIDVETFQKRVMKEFPAIVNVHHLHIWTFTPSKVVATAHVVFVSPRVYLATKAALRQFFLDEGITHVTIQPECLATQPGTSGDPSACLLRCKLQQCHERECCYSCAPHPLLSSVTSHGARHRTGAATKTGDSSGGEAGCSGCGTGNGETHNDHEPRREQEEPPNTGGGSECSGTVTEPEGITDAATTEASPPQSRHHAQESETLLKDTRGREDTTVDPTIPAREEEHDRPQELDGARGGSSTAPEEPSDTTQLLHHRPDGVADGGADGGLQVLLDSQ